MVTHLTHRLLLAATLISVATAPACTQSPAPPAQSSAAQSAPAVGPSVDACTFLTKDDIQSAAGWPVVETTPTTNPGPPALSICNFMGMDVTRVITVTYGAGSGGRYKYSSEMATAIGTRDGMLVRPAEPIEGLGIPATREEEEGGLVHVHGINSAGDELIVTASSYEASRALFIKALSRLPRR